MSEPTPSDVYRAPSSGLEVARSDGHAPSRFGLASLVMGVASVLTLIGTFTLAAVWKVGAEAVDAETEGSQNLWIGLLAMGACGIAMIGICLAIVALLQPDRLRGAAVSGLVVNVFVVLLFALLLVIGLTVGE